jgi:prephenate dehydrogenase
MSAVSLHEQQAEMSLRPFGAGGMRDIVAPAAESPEGDTEAISFAAHAVADHLDALVKLFKQLEQVIGADDEPKLFATIEAMVHDAHTLATPRN